MGSYIFAAEGQTLSYRRGETMAKPGAMEIERQTVLSFGDLPHGSACHCAICRRKKKFDVPSELAKLFVDGNIVLFTGAGISTEARSVLGDTFYETIEYILNDGISNRSFPDLMEAYCNTPAGRISLMEKIRDRFDYVFSHREIYEEATRFHRELATFFPIDTIVTTNWDTYFEDECGATPFVEDRDIALWNVAERKVLKLHGTIANLGSIVATRSDYDKCARRLSKGLIGAHLKSLLATRSTVFIGYSLRDEDFLQVYGAVRRYLSDFHRQAYFVSPEISPDDRERLSKLNLQLIETDGQFFISELKKHAQKERCLSRDDMYDGVAGLLEEAVASHEWLHEKFRAAKFPQVLFCSWYQDGLMHALERILRLRKTGRQSDLHRLQGSARSYDHFARCFQKDRNYSDAAYCFGYSNAYTFACQYYGGNADIVDPPLFFYFGFETREKSHYQKQLHKIPVLHKSAFKFAQKVVSKYPKDQNLILHHDPRLNVAKYM
jgi:hypothetical protein